MDDPQGRWPRPGPATVRPDLDVRDARFVWLGTTLPLDAFTFHFVENEHGVFQAHAYRFAQGDSTFIIECDERSWRAAGLERLDQAATVESMAVHICATIAHRATDGGAPQNKVDVATLLELL